MYKIKKGITLLVMIIAIIVLLILAGVTINLIIGENSIISKSKKSTKDYDIATGKEVIEIAISTMQVETEGELKLENLENLPNYDSRIISVKIEEDIANANYLGKYIYTIDNNFLVAYSDNSNIEDVEEDGEFIETGILSDTEYRINNTTLTFSKIVEVGENETYKTIKDGLDYLCDNGYKENSAIVLKEGTYDTQNIHTGSSSVWNSKYNEMEISIIADSPGKTFMTAGEMGEASNNASYWLKLKFYRIVFTTPVYSDVRK